MSGGGGGGGVDDVAGYYVAGVMSLILCRWLVFLKACMFPIG